MPTTAARSRDTWLFWIIAVLVLGAGLGLRDPWPADEPRFALVARQMVESGDWLFPHRGHELYSDKPPLFMWLQAIAYTLLGNWRVAFLLPSLLAALGTLWCVTDLGARLWTRRVGLYAGYALLFALQFTWQAKKAQIDPLVVFWITLANYGLLRHVLQVARNRGPDWPMWMLGWAAAGTGHDHQGRGRHRAADAGAGRHRLAARLGRQGARAQREVLAGPAGVRAGCVRVAGADAGRRARQRRTRNTAPTSTTSSSGRPPGVTATRGTTASRRGTSRR